MRDLDYMYVEKVPEKDCILPIWARELFKFVIVLINIAIWVSMVIVYVNR